MKLVKKLFISLSLLTMLNTSLCSLSAEEYCADNGGCGYTDCCRTSSLAPAIALGVIAVAAIVAVAVQNTSGHAHCHSHN